MICMIMRFNAFPLVILGLGLASMAETVKIGAYDSGMICGICCDRTYVTITSICQSR